MKILKIVAALYALLLVALVFLEARMVYPGAYMDGNAGRTIPADSPVERIEYTGQDGQLLHGHLMERSGAKGALLYLHGNGTRSAWLDGRIRRLAARFDLHVLAAEFRGFDDLDWTPTEASIIEDAQTARDHLCQRFELDPSGIVLFGRSLGGGVAAALAAEGGARAVVLERSFDRLVDVAAGHYPLFPIRFLMRNRFDSVARLTDFQGPVIQLHGTADRVVPMDHGRRLFDSLTTPSKVWVQVEGLGHNDWLPDRELDHLVSALDTFADKAAGSAPR